MVWDCRAESFTTCRSLIVPPEVDRISFLSFFFDFGRFHIPSTYRECMFCPADGVEHFGSLFGIGFRV